MFRHNLAVDKFLQFILPNTAKVFAVSISEFLDALIVATLLGSQAMSIVNLGSPIILVAATLMTLLTVGGSTIYANLCGAYDKPQAERVFTLSVITAIVVSGLFVLFAFPFQHTIVSLMCTGDKELMEASGGYFAILIASVPILTVSNLLFGFLPSAGKPKMCSLLMILANVINIGMDVVLIKYCGMGIEGAGYATICGYAVALLCYIVLYLRKKVNMSLVRISMADISRLKGICEMGSSAALSQLGFVIKVMGCNALALLYGGQTALIAFSVCMQLLSVMSIFVGGIGSSMINITATLRGQKDYAASGRVVSLALKLNFLCSAVCITLFCCFASDIAIAYQADEPQVMQMTVHAIYLFSLMMLVRGIPVAFMYYVQSIGRTAYASFISLFDGFAGQLPLAYLGSLCIGIDGLWWSFPVSTLLLMIIIIAWNYHLLHSRQAPLYKDMLLTERDTEALAEESSYELLANPADSVLPSAPLVAEAGLGMMISSYLTDMTRHRQPLKIDYLIRKYPKQHVVDIRTNVDKLTGFTCHPQANVKVVNEMILGMNCLRLTKAFVTTGEPSFCDGPL